MGTGCGQAICSMQWMIWESVVGRPAASSISVLPGRQQSDAHSRCVRPSCDRYRVNRSRWHGMERLRASSRPRATSLSSMSPRIPASVPGAKPTRCARGLAGVLINGATRDGAAIRKRQFPAACLGFSPVRSAGRLETVAIGEPVNIAAVRISQGDLVAIDDDGIVCVPAASADAVMKHAEDIVRREFERDRELEARLVR